MGFLLITISLCLFCVDVSFAQNTTVAGSEFNSQKKKKKQKNYSKFLCL